MSQTCSLDDGARKPHSDSWTRASDDSGNVRNARIATIWARVESSRLSDALTSFLFLSGLCVNFANARKQIADESAASTNSTDAQRKSEVGANRSYAMVSDSNIAIFLRRISPHLRDTPHQFLGYHRWCAIFKRADKVIAADQKVRLRRGGRGDMATNGSSTTERIVNIAILVRGELPRSSDAPHQFLRFQGHPAIFTHAKEVITADQKFGLCRGRRGDMGIGQFSPTVRAPGMVTLIR